VAALVEVIAFIKQWPRISRTRFQTKGGHGGPPLQYVRQFASALKYENFDIVIEKERDGRYPVVLWPPSFAENEYLSEEISSQDLTKIWEAFDKNQASRDVLEKVGRTLFNCLFHGSILNKFNSEFGKIRDDDSRGLRIRLFIWDPTIAKVPWELLYDPSRNLFLATWIKTPVVRYMRVSDGNRGLDVDRTLKVLVAIPSFSGLNVVEEERIIRSAFAEMEKKKLVQLEFMTDRVSVETILKRLGEKGPFHIFHFIGHGCLNKDDSFLLVNRDPIGDESDSDELIDVEQLEQLSAEDFADLFKNHGSMKLVVLNSCLGAKVSHTKPLAGIVPKLFAREIPAVVAMQYPIMNEAALRFAAKFYGTLCKGYQRGLIDVAVTEARNLMHIKGRSELSFATPVLFLRSDSGAIFDLQLDESFPEIPLGGSVGSGVVSPVAGSIDGASILSFLLRVLWRRVLDPIHLASDAPRLTALKEAREKNIEIVEQKTKEASNVEEVDELNRELEHERSQVKRLDRRLSEAFSATLQISRTALALGFVIFLASTFGLFNLVGIDDFFQHVSSNYLRGEFLGGRSFADDQIRIIMVDRDKQVGGFPNQKRSDDRAFHAEMIDALARAGASVVAIDVYPNGPSPGDTALADAVTRAEQMGTHVIMGTKGVSESGQPLTEIPPILRQALSDKIGNVESGLILAGFRPALRAVALGNEVTVGPSAQDVAVAPSFVLQTIRYFNQPANTRAPRIRFYRPHQTITLFPYDDDRLKRSIPVNDDEMLYYFSPADENILAGVRRSYQDVYPRRTEPNALQEFRGKIVMIGYDTDADLHYVNGVRQMPGVEIQASVASNILQGISLRRLSTLQNGLIILLMTVIGFVLQSTPLRRFSIRLPFESPVLKKLITIPVPLLLVLLFYLAGIYFIYSRTNWEIDMTYHVAALFFSYWIGNLIREKRDSIASVIQKLKPPKSEEVVKSVPA